MSKYNAKPIEIDGVRFASQKEGRRYQELKLLERAGEVRNLVLQPEFVLEVASVTNGVGFRWPRKVGKYRGDFAYEERYEVAARKGTLLPTVKWRAITEDVKGFKTPVYRLKKKMVEAQYGIEIREI